MLNSARVWKKFRTFALNLNGRIMAIKNELNARLQHAVEENHGDTNQTPSDGSTPLKGEVIFNPDLTNFKVGDGEHNYGNLNEFLASVAISGSYNDLTNKPPIPSNTETWTFTLDNGTEVTRTVYILNN